MRKCPMKSEFESLDPSVAEDKAKINLYKANNKMCSIIGLGQSTSHGMPFLNITKVLIIQWDWPTSSCKRLCCLTSLQMKGH